MLKNRENFPYIWRVNARLPERKGERCRIVKRYSRNSALVEFERDGHLVVTSRNYLRKAKLHTLYVIGSNPLVLRCPICGYMAVLDLAGGTYTETATTASHKTDLEMMPA